MMVFFNFSRTSFQYTILRLAIQHLRALLRNNRNCSHDLVVGIAQILICVQWRFGTVSRKPKPWRPNNRVLRAANLWFLFQNALGDVRNLPATTSFFLTSSRGTAPGPQVAARRFRRSPRALDLNRPRTAAQPSIPYCAFSSASVSTFRRLYLLQDSGAVYFRKSEQILMRRRQKFGRLKFEGCLHSELLRLFTVRS